MRIRTATQRLVALLLTVALVAALASPASAKPPKSPPPPSGPSTLVLYDSAGQWGYLGELYAIQAANLAGHFGTVATMPATSYTTGAISSYSAVVYVGSTYDEPLPTVLLDDILATTKPVLWAGFNIWELAARAGNFAARYGFTPGAFDPAVVTAVRYKGVDLTRAANNGAGILNYSYVDTGRVQVLADAVRPDGSTFPWALRSANLTYVGENPFPYASERDRYLAYSDLLFDALAPATTERHRAMVRLEDVGPDANPLTLRAIADYLYAEGIPFSVAVYPRYRDPAGVYNGGVAEDIPLKEAPEVVNALKYMQTKGGTLILHGWTHQYSNVANPYNGASGDDFEFFRAHIDADDYVRLDGPVAEDSTRWAVGRVNSAAKDLAAVGLATPTIWEFPHYAASATDYRAIATKFTTRYDRGLYFSGLLTGGAINHSRMVGQFFPYVVKDVYGSKVLPETLGDYSPVEYNHHPVRLAADLVETARKTLVVRDGFASFFYHPYLGLAPLQEIVNGINAIRTPDGQPAYSWVAASSL